MSKRWKKIDPRQTSFDFDRKIDEYRSLKEEILAVEPQAESRSVESFDEACIQLAAAIKTAIQRSGLSREQVVDGVNAYFGWTQKSKKHLSIHMFNHYLSKPVAYPIPAYLIYPLQHITKSMEPTKALAEAEDCRVISGEEIRQMAMGKLDDTIIEMQRLKRELRVRR